jgi:hypothetical protein
MPSASRPGTVKIATLYPRVSAAGVASLVVIPGTGWLFLEADSSGGLSPPGRHIPAILILVAGAAVLIASWCYWWRMGVLFDEEGVTVRNLFRRHRFGWDWHDAQEGQPGHAAGDPAGQRAPPDTSECDRPDAGS